jgi:TatD DNase family protein
MAQASNARERAEKVHFFDSHAHVDPSFFADTSAQVACLRAIADSGVGAILVPGVSPVNWSSVVECAAAGGDRLSGGIRVIYALGIHPWQVAKIDLTGEEEAFATLEHLLSQRDCALAAVGECGLDYARTQQIADRDAQMRFFVRHLKLARRFDLPLTIHGVKASTALLQALDRFPPPPSAIHGFSGSAELAQEFLKRGHSLGFGGILTNSEARRVVQALKSCPAQRMLLESDDLPARHWPRFTASSSPFLDIANKVAQIRGEPLQEIAHRTWDNACRLFRLPS